MNRFLFGGLAGTSPVLLSASPSFRFGRSKWLKWVNFTHKMYGQYFSRAWAIVNFFALSKTLNQLKSKPDCRGIVYPKLTHYF